MISYLFWDEETGEYFIVEAESYHEAITTAEDFFEKPVFENELTFEEADFLGFDTY